MFEFDSIKVTLSFLFGHENINWFWPSYKFEWMPEPLLFYDHK